ncbi:MAG: hypothetical protein GWO02_22010 [Gammaproteobacteria bacterium]|nr:hypothetical protein [Gammaproteobacteria bacterium]
MRPAAVGRLEVVVTGREVRAELTPVAPLPSGLRLNLVVLGMGLTTRIEAGENAGREARHDFVVLARRQASGRERRWRMRLPEPETHGARRHALAAWVSAPGDPTPLQATGGFLPRPLPHEGEGSQGRRPVGHGAER